MSGPVDALARVGRLKRLSPIDRAIYRQVGEGLTVREIARARSMQLMAVYKRVHRIRRALGLVSLHALMVCAVRDVTVMGMQVDAGKGVAL